MSVDCEEPLRKRKEARLSSIFKRKEDLKVNYGFAALLIAGLLLTSGLIYWFLGGSKELEIQDFFKLKNIDGFAFSGGGMAAFTKGLSVLHAVKKHNNKNLEKLFETKHVGSVSGGSWLMNSILFDKETQSSFEDGKGRFVRRIKEKMRTIAERINPKSPSFMASIGSSICMDQLKNFEGVSPSLCDEEVLAIIEKYLGLHWENKEPWKMFMEDLHRDLEEQAIKIKNLHWVNTASLLNDFSDKHAHVPVFMKYQDTQNDLVDVSIPALEKQGLKIEKELKNAISQSVSNAKLISGPSSDAPALVHAALEFVSEEKLGMLKMLKTYLERYLWKTEPFGVDKKQAALSDGAIENTGISAVVKSLQDSGIHSGNIFAVSNAESPFECDDKSCKTNNILEKDHEMKHLFEGHEGNLEPFPIIFQGKLKVARKNVHKFNLLDVLILRDLKTVKNDVYGVKKNSTYNLITIFPKCKDVKMLPYLRKEETYAHCARTILADMNKLLKKNSAEA